MKWLITMILVLTATVTFASPFLVCDMPVTGTLPTEYQITLPTGQTWMVATSPALTTGQYGFKADLVAAPVGTTSIKVKACKNDLSWGMQCSPEVSFPLVKPAPPAAMSNLELIP